MKKVKQLLIAITIGFFAITTTSCSKEEGCTDITATNYDSEAGEDDGSCTFNGKVTFWQYSGDSFNTTTVTVNGTTKSITEDITTTSGPSECSTSGTAIFEFPTGTYTYTASESGTNNTWTSSFEITKNGCHKRRLKN
ncbi:MAG: hypothetical protein JKY30_01140 [Flavobacteriales bacterium]|nr:hypothetical protein [Flavobacteriales bacterium]